MTEARRRSTAVHEAGHAVIGRVLGLVCGDATALPDEEGSLGWAHIENPLGIWERGDGRRKSLADAFCMALYAGAEAERTILGTNDVGDGTDCERATGCLILIGVRGATFVGDDAWERYEANLRRRTAELVARHRAEIERVAAALMDRDLLPSAAVDEMLGYVQ